MENKAEISSSSSSSFYKRTLEKVKNSIISANEKLKSRRNNKREYEGEDGDKDKGANSLEREREKLLLMKRALENMSEFDAVHTIALDRICSGTSLAENNAQSADSEAIAELAESIRTLGQLSPLVVRRISGDDSAIGGIFSLVCGERRYLALKMLGRREARCVIVDLPPDKLAAASIADNIQRENRDLFELGDRVRAYMRRFSLGEAEAAQKLSLSQARLRAIIEVSEFSDAERDFIRASGLSARRAALFLPIHDADERLAAMRYAESANLSSEGVRDYVERCVSSLVIAGQAPKTRRKLLLRDLRIFYNSIDRAIALMNEAGIEATGKRLDEGDAYTITVRIPKRENSSM